MKLIENIIKQLIREGYQEETYYMFFQNIKQIHEQTKKILEMDKTKVDNILKNGHDWAADHVSTSKDDIEEVHNFLSQRCKEDDFDLKSSKKKYDGIMTENDLLKYNDDNLVKLSHEVFEKYMYSDKSLKSKVKIDWEKEGLSRTGKFSGNNINRLLSKSNKTMEITEIIDQLEILKDYIKDPNIDRLIKLLIKKY